MRLYAVVANELSKGTILPLFTELLATDPEVLGSNPGGTRFSEK
jgi:hypothetical protein